MKSAWLFFLSCLIFVGLEDALHAFGQDQDEPAADAEMWTTDIQAAMRLAAAEDKDLLLNFTGSDWCIWCIRLEDEVFSKEEFQAYAADKFVLVKLDFPADDSAISDELKAQNNEWRDNFEVSGYPSIYLADDEGRPFAKTGYQEGGPEPYVTHIEGLREVRVKRDELFAAAAEAEGIERARLLDQALSMMDESLVTTQYEAVVKEIVQLDAEDEAGLRTKYFAAQDAEMRKQILSRIATAAQAQSPLLAIQTIDVALGEAKLPPMMRIEAMQTKLRLLRRLNDQEACKALLDEMIEMEGISAETRERLVIQKIYLMVVEDQAEEALALLDEIISTTLTNLNLCVAKGELLDRMGRHEEAVQAFDVAMRGAGSNFEIAFEILVAKSESLAALDRIDEAFELIEQIVADDRFPGYLKSEVMLHKALMLRDLGRIDEAQVCEERALTFAGSDEERAELLRLIEQLRKDSGR